MPKKSVDYVNELQLKSLCIRVKNRVVGDGTPDRNARINQLIQTYLRLLPAKYDSPEITRKKLRIKDKLKDRIVKLSELTCADDATYNIFAGCVLLMIKRILTKPQFSNYTFKDEFYSDATFKIVKYIYNFDHRKISKITGKGVNSFSYITQIIHNSIIYVINQHKKSQVLSLEKLATLALPESTPECLFNDPDYPASSLSYSKWIRTEDDLEHELNFVRTHTFGDGDRITYYVMPGINTIDLFSECYQHKVRYTVKFLA